MIINVDGLVKQRTFFAGMYFPIDYLPAYLQQVGRFIPITYAAQALKDIMIRNATLSDLFLPMATLASATVIQY